MYLEAEVRQNEKDKLETDLKEADYWIRKSHPIDKVYIEKYDPSGFGWVEYTGIEHGEWVSGMCLLAMFRGCYAPVRITNNEIDEELKDIRKVISETERILLKYPDRLSLKLNLRNLRNREIDIIERYGKKENFKGAL